MTDLLLDIMQELEDAIVEQEEIEEIGGLEERLLILQKIEELETRLLKERLHETGERK